jgi:hypothetical protein
MISFNVVCVFILLANVYVPFSFVTEVRFLLHYIFTSVTCEKNGPSLTVPRKHHRFSRLVNIETVKVIFTGRVLLNLDPSKALGSRLCLTLSSLNKVDS